MKYIVFWTLSWAQVNQTATYKSKDIRDEFDRLQWTEFNPIYKRDTLYNEESKHKRVFVLRDSALAFYDRIKMESKKGWGISSTMTQSNSLDTSFGYGIVIRNVKLDSFRTEVIVNKK